MVTERERELIIYPDHCGEIVSAKVTGGGESDKRKWREKVFLPSRRISGTGKSLKRKANDAEEKNNEGTGLEKALRKDDGLFSAIGRYRAKKHSGIKNRDEGNARK